jgi:HK97 gp10 family phage protein
MAKIVVTGVKQIDRSLNALGPKVANKIATRSLRKIGKLVKSKAQRNLEASPSIDTGALKRGIRVRAKKRTKDTQGVQIETTAQERFSYGGSAYAFGGMPLEFGTKHMPAEPFLRPAIYDYEDLIRGLVIHDIALTINEIAKTGRLNGKRL